MNASRTCSSTVGFGAVALALALVGCKDGAREGGNVTTTASSAVLAPAAAPASAQPVAPTTAASALSAPAKNAGTKAAKGIKVDKQNTLAIWDVSEKNEGLSVCGLVDFEVVLPVFPDAPEWQVSSPKALGTPKQEVKTGFRGPNSDSVAFRWPGTNAEVGTYPVVFTSGKDKVTVKIAVIPTMPCTAGDTAPEGVVPEDEPAAKRKR